jgi:hypothetical protein
LAAHFKALQDLGLEGRTESLGRLQAIAAHRLFQLGQRADAEHRVKLAHTVCRQAGDG